jgi:uncharacterized protein
MGGNLKMSWIQTYTGRQFWPMDPSPKDVCVEDIAHALSLTCRFTGHCLRFYSVAQHSVLVAGWLVRSGMLHGASTSTQINAVRAALLHDAAEAYMADIARPVKRCLPNVKAIENRLATCIYEALGVTVDAELTRAIKHCDDVLLATEARDLMRRPPVPWAPLPEPSPSRIVAMDGYHAERRWMKEWKATEEAINKQYLKTW